MPAVSKKQERFMQAVAHNPAFAKKAGVPQSVGKEFTKSGGSMVKAKKMAIGGILRGGGIGGGTGGINRQTSMQRRAAEAKETRRIQDANMKAMSQSVAKHGRGSIGAGPVKKMAAGGLSTAMAKKLASGMALKSNLKPSTATAKPSTSTGKSSGLGEFIGNATKIASNAARVGSDTIKQLQAKAAHEKAVKEQFAREAAAKKYNERAKKTGRPQTSPTGFDLPKSRSGGFKTGGKVKKMATGGMTSMYKGPTPPKTAYGAGAKSTPSYVTQAATAPTKYGNEAFDRSARRAAFNEKQTQEVAARDARAKEVRQMMTDRAQGKMPMFGAGVSPKKMATGGLAKAHKAADGIAKKGRTKAKQIKMAYGGKC